MTVIIKLTALNYSCVQGWLRKRSPQEAEMLRELFSGSFSELYRFSVQSLDYKMDMLEAFIIMQCINMLQGLLQVPKVFGKHVGMCKMFHTPT